MRKSEAFLSATNNRAAAAKHVKGAKAKRLNLYRAVMAEAEGRDIPADELALIASIAGEERPSKELNGAMFARPRQIGNTIGERITSLVGFEQYNFYRVRLNYALWTSSLNTAEWNVQGMFRDASFVTRLAVNGVAAATAGVRIAEAGEVQLRFGIDAIVFAHGLSSTLAQSQAHLRSKLYSRPGDDAFVVTPIEATQDAVTSAFAALLSVPVGSIARASKIPRATGWETATRLRTFLLLGSVPLKRLVKGFGEGDSQLRAALAHAKTKLETDARNGAPLATPDRRARDIARISRLAGFGDTELPFVKVR